MGLHERASELLDKAMGNKITVKEYVSESASLIADLLTALDTAEIEKTMVDEAFKQVEIMRLVLAPLSVKAGVSDETLLSLLAEAEKGVRQAVLQ